MSYLVFAFLALLAAGFFLWPLLRQRYQRSALEAARQTRLATNVRLFQEHLADLQAALQEGRIDQAQFEQLKLEQERSLLEDEASQEVLAARSAPWAKAFLVAFCAACLLLALALYLRQGSGPDLEIRQLIEAKQEQDYLDALHGRDSGRAAALKLTEVLEARLESRPDQAQYWFMLARTRMELGEVQRAVEAYQQVLELDPQSAMVMAELAQAMFLRDQNQASDQVQQLASASLRLDSENTTALGLLGIWSFQQEDFPAAIDYWERAMALLGPESAGAQSLKAGITRAKQEVAKRQVAGHQAEENQRSPTTPAGVSISLEVSLGDVPAGLSPDLPVFVYARHWQGSPMPLAISRLRLSDLPAKVSLTEAMAMSPAASLAQAEQIELVARISLSGEASARAGDWQATMGPLDPRSPPSAIRLVIDQKIAE